jgi:hypothetical protein
MRPAKADFASSSQHVRERQRIATLDDMRSKQRPDLQAGRARSLLGGADGEHGNIRIRRKKTCGR